MLPAVLSDHHIKWISSGLKKYLWSFRLLLSTLEGWSRSENLPNQLTILRLFMGLLFFLVLYLGFFDLALVVFVSAMVTDFLDGYLARRNGQISDFGRIVDPLADKLIICGGFLLLIFHLPIVKPWMVITIISRELLISLLRGYAELNGITFPSNLWGKVKMTLQSLTIGLLVFVIGHGQEYWILTGAEGLLWFTVMLTVLSGFAYLLQAACTDRRFKLHLYGCCKGDEKVSLSASSTRRICHRHGDRLSGWQFLQSRLVRARMSKKPHGVP